MTNKSFSYYLIKNNIVDKDKIFECLNDKKKHPQPIGQLALKKKLLTPNQIKEIINEQKSDPSLFGEIAVNKQFILQQQINELLYIQKKGPKLLGEVLVEKKILTHKELVKHINTFNKLNIERNKNIKSSLKSIPSIYLELVELTSNVVENAFLVKLNQLINITNYYNSIPKSTYDYFIFQKTKAKYHYIFGLALNNDFIDYISSITLNLPSITEEMKKDCLEEFSNVINGHIYTRLADLDERTKLDPTIPSLIPYNEFEFPSHHKKSIAIDMLCIPYTFQVQIIVL